MTHVQQPLTSNATVTYAENSININFTHTPQPYTSSAASASQSSGSGVGSTSVTGSNAGRNLPRMTTANALLSAQDEQQRRAFAAPLVSLIGQPNAFSGTEWWVNHPAIRSQQFNNTALESTAFGQGRVLLPSDQYPLGPNSQSRRSIARPRASTIAGDGPVAAEFEMQLSRHKLKATSRTSALLAGFAMVALVELDYDKDTPRVILIAFAIITTLLVSVHLLALMMSTCMLPHMEALGTNVQSSPHHQLRWYIEMSWFFSTCLGLILFLLEIGIVFWIKFHAIQYDTAAIISTAILVPVFLIFLIFTYHFYRKLMAHHVKMAHNKLQQIQKEDEEESRLFNIQSEINNSNII